MARNGKIARLPRDIRAQLNTRLQDGAEGRLTLRWLNSLPEVKAVLAQFFDGRPVNEQNLSDWRQGGYEEWLTHHDILAQAAELRANQCELDSVAPGQSFTDHLAAAISFRYAAILAAPGVELDEKSRAQLRSLGRTCQAVVKLRRSDQNAARLKIETERWERVREQMDADRADALKRRQREDLAAPVWGALKKAERLEQFGGGKAARMAVDLLEEIDNCPDPAHFQSKVLASLSVPEMRRDIQELINNPPKKKTPVQAAAEMLEEMDACLAKSQSKHQAAQPPSRRPRHARRPGKRASARRVRRVHPVRQARHRSATAPLSSPSLQAASSPTQPNDTPSSQVPPFAPAPAPEPQPKSSLSRPPVPPAITDPPTLPIKPNQGVFSQTNHEHKQPSTEDADHNTPMPHP